MTIKRKRGTLHSSINGARAMDKKETIKEIQTE